MLTEFLTWWRDTLAELLPARLSGAPAGREALVVAPAQGQHLALALRRGREERPLGLHAPGSPLPLRSRPARIVLRAPGAAMLGRDTVLPLAAEPQLRQVLGFEIDRLTPFGPEELFWTFAVRRRDRERKRLHLHLSLVPRAAVQPMLDALAAWGLSATEIEADEPDEGPVRLPLRGLPAPFAPRADRAVAVLCGLLALAVAATPFALQARDAARVDARIATLRPLVDEAQALRRRADARDAGADVIAAARLRLGNPLAVLAAVTELLPDDTSLTELTLRQGRLTLAGQSASAARLIGALASDPLIRNPDFAAPVTRLNDGRADLFSIRAELAR